MKIACIDKTAADRVKLQQLFDRAFEECRGTIGHLKAPQTYPCSKDELLINTPPDIVAVGSCFSTEEAYVTCRDISQAYPNLPVFLFIEPETYTLRTLRRFERVTQEIFSTTDPSIRLLHKVSSAALQKRNTRSGKLVVVTGVKGGVGSTSLVSGLAHAAQALNKTAVALDLSPCGSLIQYMGTDRLQSSDFTALLVDQLSPDHRFVEKLISVAPNGVHVLLPPSGGSDVRELWLRDPTKFEVTLSVIDILLDTYDVVIVDSAHAEGILNFALNARADSRLLVSSNDPASVHLLSYVLSAIVESPSDGSVQILLNCLQARGLTKEDVLDFLYINDHFNESMASLKPIPYDAQGRNWIGTGNTFYTECPVAVQQILEDTLTTLLMSESELEDRRLSRETLFSGIRRIAERMKPESSGGAGAGNKTRLALPHHTNAKGSISSKLAPKEIFKRLPPTISQKGEDRKSEIEEERQSVAPRSNGNLGYHPPVNAEASSLADAVDSIAALPFHNQSVNGHSTNGASGGAESNVILYQPPKSISKSRGG